MGEDWFRTTEWTAAAQRDFETRLKRARPHNRPQYLRAKAIALREHGGDAHLRAARELNERIVRDYPDSHFDLVVAHEQLGLIAEREHALEDAISHYRRALHLSEEGAPQGDAFLRLPELLVAGDLASDRVEEAEGILARIDDQSLAFSSQRFRYRALRARLADRRGDREAAAAFAESALGEWHRAQPDFHRHPDLGWVRTTPAVIEELQRLSRLA